MWSNKHCTNCDQGEGEVEVGCDAISGPTPDPTSKPSPSPGPDPNPRAVANISVNAGRRSSNNGAPPVLNTEPRLAGRFGLAAEGRSCTVWR